MLTTAQRKIVEEDVVDVRIASSVFLAYTDFAFRMMYTFASVAKDSTFTYETRHVHVIFRGTLLPDKRGFRL